MHLENLVFTDPQFSTRNELNMTRDEIYSEGIRKHVHAWEVMKKHNITETIEQLAFIR